MAAAYEISLLNKRAIHHGYVINHKQPKKDSEIFLENYFKTDYPKNALLSYIIYPFLGTVLNNHSNHRECFVMAEILNELGYKVDIINWDNDSFLPQKNYELVIDNHNNLARLSPYFLNGTKKIFHATNAHWLFQNCIEYNRYYEFFLKEGIAITPPRLMVPGNSSEYCDVISMFGNEFTKTTYGKYGDKIHGLPMSVTTSTELFTNRIYSTAKNNFIWLNSPGALLKGLDIVLDAFSILPDCELFICGDIDRDNRFKKIISQQLSKAKNIKIIGWVDTDKEIFKTLALDCAWVIGTSFSEGGGGSVLNCMAKGLIPVVSRSSSLTLKENSGFYLENNSAIELAGLINKLKVLSDEVLREMSLNAYNFVASNHTLEIFKNKYKKFLVEVLN